MRIFSMDLLEETRTSIIIADNIEIAINLFKKAHAFFPEKVKELTANGETIIIQGIEEPEYKLNF